MQKCLPKDVVVIYPLTVVLFLIPVCLGFYRPLNMKDIEIIFYIDFITFFYICSEYTSLSKWFSILLSLSFTIYTILLALQVSIQLQKIRDENPFKKDDDQKKKKKRKKRKSNSMEDKSKPVDPPPALRDKSDLENVKKENGSLKLEVKRLRQTCPLETDIDKLLSPLLMP